MRSARMPKTGDKRVHARHVQADREADDRRGVAPWSVEVHGRHRHDAHHRRVAERDRDDARRMPAVRAGVARRRLAGSPTGALRCRARRGELQRVGPQRDEVERRREQLRDDREDERPRERRQPDRGAELVARADEVRARARRRPSSPRRRARGRARASPAPARSVAAKRDCRLTAVPTPMQHDADEQQREDTSTAATMPDARRRSRR